MQMVAKFEMLSDIDVLQQSKCQYIPCSHILRVSWCLHCLLCLLGVCVGVFVCVNWAIFD